MKNVAGTRVVEDALYVAVDLGAGSGRVILAGVGPDELRLEEIHRFHYAPSTPRDGHLRWDFEFIWSQIRHGLRAAGQRARQLQRPICSVGVDTWGVDYGFVDADGTLLGDPICYRDERTQGAPEQIFARIPRATVIGTTGIQVLVFNTLYQLWAHTRSGLPARAFRLLMMPDLIHHRLSGRMVTEYSNATTTQMVGVRDQNWDKNLIGTLGMSPDLFPEIVPAGTDLGPVLPDVAADLDLESVHVVVPATHDTGSAVLGAPLNAGWAYISSGTWSLVGVERDKPYLGAELGRHNFTNEGGAFGTVRLLKNVMGLWLLERCRSEWQDKGLAVDHDSLLAAIAQHDDAGLIFPDDPRLLNPPSMVDAINTQLVETKQTPTQDPAAMGRIILDSLACRYRSVLHMIATMTGQAMAGVQIVGGGSRNAYLNQMTADLTGLPVKAGPVEATALGNVVVQAITAGRFVSLSAARAHVAAHTPTALFVPRAGTGIDALLERYGQIEAVASPPG